MVRSSIDQSLTERICFECTQLRSLVSQRDDEILRLKFDLRNQHYKVDSLKFLLDFEKCPEEPKEELVM